MADSRLRSVLGYPWRFRVRGVRNSSFRPVSPPWPCSCDARLSSDGSRRPRFPAVLSTMQALRLPAMHPFGLSVKNRAVKGPSAGIRHHAAMRCDALLAAPRKLAVSAAWLGRTLGEGPSGLRTRLWFGSSSQAAHDGPPETAFNAVRTRWAPREHRGVGPASHRWQAMPGRGHGQPLLARQDPRMRCPTSVVFPSYIGNSGGEPGQQAPLERSHTTAASVPRQPNRRARNASRRR